MHNCVLPEVIEFVLMGQQVDILTNQLAEKLYQYQHKGDRSRFTND